MSCKRVPGGYDDTTVSSSFASLLTLAEERQQRRRGEGLKESEIRGALLFVDAYGD